jgi:hypothetical protein
MAAIIARITREKRERDLRLLKEIKSSKCNYILKPFPQTYIPELHNKADFFREQIFVSSIDF